MATNRLLSEPDLDQFREWAAKAPGAGTGRVPTDLTLLIGHLDAQAAELRRARQHEHAQADAIAELIDLVERGGSDDLRDAIVSRARATQRG
jgi:hypothetical protein